MEKLVVVGDNLARELAVKIGGRFVAVEEKIFPDGEIKPRLKKEFSAKNAVLLIQKKEKESINNYLFKFLLLSRKLRDLSDKVIGVMPYLPYSRQDKIFLPGEPLSAKYVAELVEKNLDVFVTVNMHEHRKNIKELFSIPAYNLSIFGFIASEFSKLGPKATVDLVLVGPDEEARNFIDDFRKTLALDYVVLHKRRDTKTGEVSFAVPDFNFKNKDILILDDVASSAKTLIKAGRLLKKQGARSLSFAICHGLFVKGALNRLRQLEPRRLIVTNTVENAAAEYDVTDCLFVFLKKSNILK